MTGFLWAIAATTVVFAGVMSYGLTRRYGWGAAVAVPVVALAAVIGMTWQDEGMGFAEGMGLIRGALVFALPVLAGAVVGIAIAWRQRA